MDDEVQGFWQIDPSMRADLRLKHVRTLMTNGSFTDAAVEAEELLDEEPDHAEGLALLGEALLELGDAEGAVMALTHHLHVVEKPTAQTLAIVAAARYHHCDLPGAAEAAREAVRLAPDLADGHGWLGLALEHLPGRATESAMELVAASQLDPARFPLPLRLDQAAWEKAVAGALGHLHPRLQHFWDGVPVRIQELPPVEELRRNDPPITPAVAGLCSGAPPEDQDPWTSKPDVLQLFARNLARAPSWDKLVERLADVLDQEARTWIGLGNEDSDVEDSA